MKIFTRSNWGNMDVINGRSGHSGGRGTARVRMRPVMRRLAVDRMDRRS